MKKTAIIFVIATTVILSVVLWLMLAKFEGNIGEILMIGGVVIIVGFAIYTGIERIRSLSRKEPYEDELSKKIMTKASSLAFYISLYFWLFIMYLSDKTIMETHSLIGAGIIGMSIIFLLSWLGVKFIGMKNG